MHKVLFNDVDEFLRELELVERDAIVRVSVERRGSPHFPGTLFGFSALAGVVNSSGQLVELRVYCGDAMVGGAPQPAVQHANQLVATLQQRIGAMGFEVRAGAFVPV